MFKNGDRTWEILKSLYVPSLLSAVHGSYCDRVKLQILVFNKHQLSLLNTFVSLLNGLHNTLWQQVPAFSRAMWKTTSLSCSKSSFHEVSSFDWMFPSVVRNSEQMFPFHHLHVINDLIDFSCMFPYSSLFSLLNQIIKLLELPLDGSHPIGWITLFTLFCAVLCFSDMCPRSFLRYFVWSYIQLTLKAYNLISVTVLVASYQTRVQ